MRSSCGVLVAVTVLIAAVHLVMPESTGAQSYVSMGDGGWEYLKPTPCSRQWTAAHFLDDETGWVVGPHFDMLKTTDGGQHWAPQGYTLEKFAYDICFSDRNHGCVVGSGSPSGADQTGIILKTSNGGATWEKVLDGKVDGLRSVSFANNRVGWAVGGQTSREGIILKTTDGGATWFEQDCPLSVSLNEQEKRSFVGVSFLDENTGWVLAGVGGMVHLYKTNDGGRTWSHTSPTAKGYPAGIQFLDANTGWILAHQAILRTTDGGRTWTERQFADVTDAFHFSDALNGLVLLNFGSKMMRTRDGGETWTPVPGAKASGFSPDICMGDRNTGWAVGDQAILRTSDGGSTWQSQATAQGDNVYGVHYASSRAACAVGYSRTETGASCLVLNTEDNWQTWSRQLLPVAGGLSRLHFVDANTGWARGPVGMIVATRDGGKTWQVLDTGTDSIFDGLYFLDSQTGWAIGREGALVATSDGGATWRRLSTGTMDDMAGVFFLDKNTGWISGLQGRIMKTADGGRTWKRQPTGTMAGISDVFFTDENTGWAAGDGTIADKKGGILLRTTDGGNTWTRQDTGIREGEPNTLWAIRFLNEKEGWIAGGAMLHTSDGGQSWNPQYPGMLGTWDVHFADADNGCAVGRDEILRTTTGGLPGAVWAKKQEDGKDANFGHLVVTKKSDGYLLAEHPDSRVGIHIKTSDSRLNVGDYIYIHGKIASENGEKIITADSIEIMCAGWGILPEK